MILKDTYIKQLEKLNPIKYKFNILKKMLKDKIIHIYSSEISIFTKKETLDKGRASISPLKDTYLLEYEYLNKYDFEIINMAFHYKIHIEIAADIHKKTNEKYHEYLKDAVDADGTIDIYKALEKTKIFRQEEINKYI